jgi:hypothetical protein
MTRTLFGHAPQLIFGLFAVAFGAQSAMAQTVSPSFALTGHIEKFRLDTPADKFSAAKITVRGIDVVLPKHLLITMPGQYLTAQDLFRGPTMQAPPQGENSGLALLDASAPRVPFEAELIGNIVNGVYVAGIAHISQGALHSGAGFIQRIDHEKGELTIGAQNGAQGAHVRLNDPEGVYGATSTPQLDARFQLDKENSPVHARTGFPVCIPRSATADDPKCPRGNRPADSNIRRFTCARPGAPAAAVDAPRHDCNPELPIPLRVGDYVTYAGMLQELPGAGFLIAAHGLEAELGVYTSPGTEPVYVFVEEAIQGTKGEAFPNIPQEETTRFRIVGFTTDPSRNVEILIADIGREVGGVNDIGVSLTGPDGLAPSNLAQLGRFRNTWPSKDSARAVRRDAIAQVVGSPHAKLANGLTSGRYGAPVGEYIYPELTRFGVPGYALAVAFENFCFLRLGGGTMPTDSGPQPVQPLTPFPESGHPLSQPVGGGRACDGQ